MSLRTAAATAALVLATSSVAIAAAAMGPVKFTLHPQNQSGETGYVTLTQDGDNVVVSVTTENAPAVAQPVHIHHGTCDTLVEKPTYPLTTLQGGTSTTTLKNMTLAQLQTGDFAVNIHHSTADVATYYACGDIPKMKM
jgi:Cu/Zn superoxide dismutase